MVDPYEKTLLYAKLRKLEYNKKYSSSKKQQHEYDEQMTVINKRLESLLGVKRKSWI